MSTNEHVTDQDLEYGPTPAGAKYEHTDIDTSVGYKFALWLVVAMLISVAIVYGTFWFFENRTQAADAAAQKYPLAVGQQRNPPAPNLQMQPFKDVYMLRQGEADKLGSYGWVDKDGGIARIPIDRAMEMLLQRGLPARSGGGNGVNVVTQDSSSGRTIVPR
ncbi:MAG: hypothetical protein AB7N29_02315 [Vicinamibacterales bacterium]